jgi:hypothetical protein
MSDDTTALRRLLDGYRAEIARRNALIRAHRDLAAELETANTIDTAHAEVAAALIAQLRADENATGTTGKAAATRVALLAALHDGADISVCDGKAVALAHANHGGGA